jgi:hypothetical protein
MSASLTATPAFGDVPLSIAQALALGEARREPDQRWAFTCNWTSFERRDGDVTVDTETLVARYDPRRAEGEELQLLIPASADGLTEGQKQMWESMSAVCRSIDNNPMNQREDSRSNCGRRLSVQGPRSGGRLNYRYSQRRDDLPDVGELEQPTVTVASEATTEVRTEEREGVETIVVTASCGGRQQAPTDWDSLRQIIGDDLTLLEETAQQQRYAFRLNVPGATGLFVQPLLRHFRGELTVAADPPKLTGLRFYATPFRVPGVARMNELDIVIDYAEVEPGGPIAPVRVDQNGDAHAMRHRVEGRSSVAFSDFERVEVP